MNHYPSPKSCEAPLFQGFHQRRLRGSLGRLNPSLTGEVFGSCTVAVAEVDDGLVVSVGVVVQ